MTGICEGRVAVVTGAGRGLGRAHALEFARQGALVQTALEAFGQLDVLVNNAGFLRDRMLVNLSEQDWDDVVRVHLKGHFLTLRHAGAHWRDQYKMGNLNDARVINTSSGAGLL